MGEDGIIACWFEVSVLYSIYDKHAAWKISLLGSDSFLFDEWCVFIEHAYNNNSINVMGQKQINKK